MTPLRRRVLELVWNSHRPVGAYAILDDLREGDKAAAPPTVYRALDFLMEQGLIHRIESLNAFVGCDHPEDRHVSQFLICAHCGAAVEIDDRGIANPVKKSAADAGFTVNRFTVEQISEAVGYSDSTALRRLMKKATGASPSHYRARGA